MWKKDQLKKSIFSKSARKVVVRDPKGESLLQVSGWKMLPSKAWSVRKVLLLTVIFDRMIFAGRDESEQHLRGEHFEEYKSLFARECFLKTRHHEKYREWETQEVYIEGLTFCNLDEMETHGRKLKKEQV